MNSELTTSGDARDVATFFCRSIRTLDAWCAERPPRISFYEQDGKRVFGEEAVVEYRAAGLVASRRLEPGEAKEIARREWRQHLEVRVTEFGMRNLEGRVSELEKILLREAAA